MTTKMRILWLILILTFAIFGTGAGNSDVLLEPPVNPVSDYSDTNDAPQLDTPRSMNKVIPRINTYYKISTQNYNGFMSAGTMNPSLFSHALIFSAAPGKTYKVRALGNHNRFIVFGSTDGVNYIEIARINHPSDDETITFHNIEYIRCFVQLHYNSEEDDYNCTAFAFEENTTTNFEEFNLFGVPASTKIEAIRYADQTRSLHVENVKISTGNTPADEVHNLCFVCGKWINKPGKVPDYEGFLYFDDLTQKFYYSCGTPDNPQYLFTWDISLANNEHCANWSPTITKEGDIIFLRDHQRQNPIVYPHDDYTHPYVVDFGSRKKPYAWLVSSSVVQYNDGSFVFGDYAYHSQEDERNDDRRIIWRVEPPYNDPENWVQVHSFKHVYFTSGMSDEPDNEIGHIHSVMYDFYSDDLYCTTGDIDRHCRLWKSTDHGKTWSAIPGAVGTTENTITQADGQKWRMTNAVFTSDAMWWATDAAVPFHKLFKCMRDSDGHIDFSTLTEVADLESPVLENYYSQRTYIIALMRNPDGILMLDRGEPRPDKLDIKFYDFKTERVITLKTFYRAETDASTLDLENRIGIPMQCTTIYQPECMDGIITGGGKVVRPNNTSLFNNSLINYVGAMKLSIR